MTKTDRRIQRTRKLFQEALIALVRERGYDAITIQDIANRANLGRTTFYLHFNSKDDLFISCHESVLREFHFGLTHVLSREELLSPEAAPGMVSAYRHLQDERAMLYSIFRGKDGLLILSRLRESNAQEIKSSLSAAFETSRTSIPLDLLANYLAGAQIALVQWWLEKRQSHTLEDLAQIFHRLQRAAICDAFGLVEYQRMK